MVLVDTIENREMAIKRVIFLFCKIYSFLVYDRIACIPSCVIFYFYLVVSNEEV